MSSAWCASSCSRPKRRIRTRCSLTCAPGSPSRRDRRGARRSCCKSSLPAARSRNRRTPRSRSACGFRAPSRVDPRAAARAFATASSKSSSPPVGLRPKSRAPKWLAAAAVLLAAVAAGGYWYTQRLPVADIETLTSSASAPEAVEESYRRLRGLPGFEQRADELWLAALDRQSRAATTLADAVAADTRLRELPGQDAAADRLLSEFWLRRARERAHAEQRDAAILLAQRGAALAARRSCRGRLSGRARRRRLLEARAVAAPRERARVLAHDVCSSGSRLDRRAATSLADAARLDGGNADARRRAHRAHGARALRADARACRRRRGNGGRARAVARRPARRGAASCSSRWRRRAEPWPRSPFRAATGTPSRHSCSEASQGSALAQLADEGVRGVWRLTVVDREAGNTGAFGGWGLRFGDTVVRDDPPELVPIPDPVRSGEVAVQAAAERAVAWPVSPGVVGTLAVWNLATGQLEHDLTLPTAPRNVALDPTGARVLAATERLLMVWNAADGALAARVGTETEFVLPPVFSPDGGYVAIAERVDGANPLYSVLRSADGSLVGTIEGTPDVQGWELGPGGRYAALQGPDTVVRVLETRRGAELRRLPHSHAVERLLHSSDGAVLLTVDRAGAIASWPLALASAALGRPLGRTVSAATVSASADGRRLAFTRDDGAVAVLDVATGVELYRLRIARSVPVTRTQLSADGTELVTQSAATLKTWRLPAKPVTPPSVTVDAVPTALALDRDERRARRRLGERPTADRRGFRAGRAPVAVVLRSPRRHYCGGLERQPRSRGDGRQRRHRARVGSCVRRSDRCRRAACGRSRDDRGVERRRPVRGKRRGGHRPCRDGRGRARDGRGASGERRDGVGVRAGCCANRRRRHDGRRRHRAARGGGARAHDRATRRGRDIVGIRARRRPARGRGLPMAPSCSLQRPTATSRAPRDTGRSRSVGSSSVPTAAHCSLRRMHGCTRSRRRRLSRPRTASSSCGRRRAWCSSRARPPRSASPESRRPVRSRRASST